ncbi:MAG: PAS domain-containing protein, partial [Deltaproteobacteria bacterium]|nr:PAS domain-containing protein [Deltaproteobacteria bacterium]
MSRARLRRQIALPMLVLVAVALAASTWQASRLLHDFHLQRTGADLAARAALVEQVLGDQLQQPRHEQLDVLAKRLSGLAEMRVTIIGADGFVLGESDKDPTLMDNHARRPEVAAALAGTAGSAIRFSDTIGQPMMYAARPVVSGGRVVGVVRTGLALEAVESALRSLYLRAATAALAVLAIAAGLGLWTTRRITRPLEELETSAERYSRGDLTAPAPAGGSLEITRVATAMHNSAVELDNRIRTLVAERNEQEAVLASMVEGVLAVDRSERVMALNAAGAELLEIDASHAIGRSIQEVARNAELQRFVADVLAAGQPAERHIAMHGEESRFVQAHGAPVRDHAGDSIGVVVVLNDVTRLHLLETVRRDFVANVSHELRTPITSIKGFLETLLGGAIDDPANARRFVEIAARQAGRLGAIIDDLLLLSRVEQESDHYSIERAATPLDSVVTGAIEVCALKAEQKGVDVVSRC